MCGIFGVIYTEKQPVELVNQTVEKGIQRISNRGPDNKSWSRNEFNCFDVVLVHTRLAIIDVNITGNQPMKDSSGRWLITYNGEIYNFKEIRKELELNGIEFKGESDTEVLINAWALWGVNALSRFNGMFAFAVYDKIEGEIWLVRDRFGVKPLFWGVGNRGEFIFSSSVSSVAGFIKPEVDSSYCARGVFYKVFDMDGSESPFREIKAVPSASFVRIQLRNGGFEIKEANWYSLRDAVALKKQRLLNLNQMELLDECRNLIDNAVTCRMRSDVGFSVSLSGGVDSSTIAAIASNNTMDLKGFTYGDPLAIESEGPIVYDFSKEKNIDTTYIWPDYDYAKLDKLLERTINHQESPFSGLSVLAQNEVFHTTNRSGVKVLLGGQGGDEIFAGYRKFFIVALREAINDKKPIRMLKFMTALLLMLFNEISQFDIYRQAIRRYSKSQKNEFKILDWDVSPINLWGGNKANLAERQIEDIKYWSIPTLLRYEDRNSMGNGVETRLPFLDYNLVEFALALPTSLKIKRGYGKWFLRQSISNLVPNYIRLNRMKRGFDVTQDWVSNGIGRSLRERILDNKVLLSPYIKSGTDIEKKLTNQALLQDKNLLDEALTLAWLSNQRFT